MKTKIALAINYNYPDYGGMLQAFATQFFLEMNGFDTKAIDFNELSSDINRRKRKAIRYRYLSF